SVTAMQSRVGLNTGLAVVGNMGSRVRFNYTMMGDSVNLAARMESGAKAWGAAIMCTEATRLPMLPTTARPVLSPTRDCIAVTETGQFPAPLQLARSSASRAC
ncbi:MAG: adenylate/guanylate cyclase domain-containing protein, partial [Opitutaceae bacterium]